MKTVYSILPHYKVDYHLITWCSACSDFIFPVLLFCYCSSPSVILVNDMLNPFRPWDLLHNCSLLFEAIQHPSTITLPSRPLSLTPRRFWPFPCQMSHSSEPENSLNYPIHNYCLATPRSSVAGVRYIHKLTHSQPLQLRNCWSSLEMDD